MQWTCKALLLFFKLYRQAWSENFLFNQTVKIITTTSPPLYMYMNIDNTSCARCLSSTLHAGCMQHEMGLILSEAGVPSVFVTWTHSREFGGNAQAEQLADVSWRTVFIV